MAPGPILYSQAHLQHRKETEPVPVAEDPKPAYTVKEPRKNERAYKEKRQRLPDTSTTDDHPLLESIPQQSRAVSAPQGTRPISLAALEHKAVIRSAEEVRHQEQERGSQELHSSREHAQNLPRNPWCDEKLD